MADVKGIRSPGRDIYSVNFADYLPETLKRDPKMKALATAVTEQMLGVSSEINNVLIYSRIDELSEELIDILAFDMHVDWYEHSYPIAIKRDIIKDSVKVHKKKGTKYAIEKVLNTIYPYTIIEEWFDYGGNPFHFRIRIDGEYNSTINIIDILKKIVMYKRLSAHLETVCIEYIIKVLNNYKNRNAVRVKLNLKPVQGNLYSTRKVLITSEVKTTVCSQKAHVKIHSYLDGTWKLDGSRKLNGGEHELL